MEDHYSSFFCASFFPFCLPCLPHLTFPQAIFFPKIPSFWDLRCTLSSREKATCRGWIWGRFWTGSPHRKKGISFFSGEREKVSYQYWFLPALCPNASGPAMVKNESTIFLLQMCQIAADVWEKDVWEFQAKSGSSGFCCLLLYFLGKIAVQEMSGKTPGSPRHPSSRRPRPSDNVGCGCGCQCFHTVPSSAPPSKLSSSQDSCDHLLAGQQLPKAALKRVPRLPNCHIYHWGQKDYLPNFYSRQVIVGNCLYKSQKSLGVHKVLVHKIWFTPPPLKRAQNEEKPYKSV